MLADTVAIIYKGRILVQGTLSELKDKVLGQSEYEIKFTKPWNGNGMDSLKGVSVISHERNSLKVRVERPEETNPIMLDSLTAQGASIMALQESSRTLEQAYLKVMSDAQGGLLVQQL